MVHGYQLTALEELRDTRERRETRETVARNWDADLRGCTRIVKGNLRDAWEKREEPLSCNG